MDFGRETSTLALYICSSAIEILLLVVIVVALGDNCVVPILLFEFVKLNKAGEKLSPIMEQDSDRGFGIMGYPSQYPINTLREYYLKS